MAWYYVKDDPVGDTGTATGDGGRSGTELTGTWSTTVTEFYASIEAAYNATTPPGSGDFIICSDDHDHDYGAAKDLLIPDGVTIKSVDNANRENYAIGASEKGTGGDYDLDIGDTDSTIISIHGMTFGCDGDPQLGAGATQRIIFRDCTFKMTSATASRIFVLGSSPNSYYEYHDCFIECLNAGQEFRPQGGDHHFYNLQATGSHVKINDLFSNSSSGGSTTVSFYESDLSDILIAAADLSGSLTSGYKFTFNRSRLSDTSITTTSYNPNNINRIFESSFGTDGNADSFNYMRQNTDIGTIEEDLTTYLNASFDGGTTKFSLQIDSDANASPYDPARFKVASFAAQDLSTAQTVTMEITSDASLTDNDIWMEIVRNDTTDLALGVRVSTQNADIFGAGSALSAPDDPGWTVPGAETYQLTKDLTALSGVTNGRVDVYACIGKASISANFNLPTIAAT